MHMFSERCTKYNMHKYERVEKAENKTNKDRLYCDQLSLREFVDRSADQFGGIASKERTLAAVERDRLSTILNRCHFDCVR